MTNPDPRDLEALAQLRERLWVAEQTSDATLLEEVYADDAIIMAEYAPTIEGRDACLEFARSALASLDDEFERHIIPTSEELILSGDIAVERGSFSQTLLPRAGGGAIEEHGRYLWMYSRGSDGAWRVARIIWNMQSSSSEEPAESEE